MLVLNVLFTFSLLPLILQQDVEKFTDIEKLYLYLKLPSGPSNGNDKRTENQRASTPGLCDHSGMSSSRTQQMYAFNWIRNHLEEHPETSLPKQEVYDEYKSYCDSLAYHPLSAADFGKIMKNVFPNMKARRLGMRGKSKYCYSGLRKKAFVHMPSLPNLDLQKSGVGCEPMEPSSGQSPSAEDDMRSAACGLVCEWAQKVLSRHFDAVEDLARFLLNSHYIGTKSMAALTVMTGAPTGLKTPTPTSAFVPTSEASSFQPQVKTLASPSVDAKQQLQRKIQKKQQEQKLQSPLPGEAQGQNQARRTEASNPGPAIPCGSPALLSPQPTIGIVVAAVPSPITVQRSRQLMTSPSPVGSAEGKVIPTVNFQVVTHTQSLTHRQSPKTPQNISASPVGDRLARHRYPQILPKPSATGAITLRSPPTLLITNSPMKTHHVIQPQLSSHVNVVKMTAISLTPSNTISTSSKSMVLRPASASAGVGTTTTFTTIAALEEVQQQGQSQGGPTATPQCPAVRPGAPVSTVAPEAIITDNNPGVNSDKLSTIQKSPGGSNRPERATEYRASSEPSLLVICSPGPERVAARSKSYPSSSSPPTSATNAATIRVETKQDSSTANCHQESPFYLTVVPSANRNTPSISGKSSSSNGLSAVSLLSARDSSPCASRSMSPQKRTGPGLDSSHVIPVKRVFISQQPLGVTFDPKPVVTAAVKRVPARQSTPARPESAPCRVTVKQHLVPTQVLAPSDSPIANAEISSFSSQTVTSQHGSTMNQHQLPNIMSQTSDSSDQLSGLHQEMVDFASSASQHGSTMNQHQLSNITSQTSDSSDQLSGLHQEMVDFHGSTMDYFSFNDDDMTQDSIVEELVQMEEQMKLKGLQPLFSSCVDNISLQGQPGGPQGPILNTHHQEDSSSFYQSAHSSITPIQTPTLTPTPTPTEMTLSGHELTRESPCCHHSMAPITPVEGPLGGRHTPISALSNCSSGIPPSPVECRNPFAFTPINSSMAGGYHNASVVSVSSSPIKPMQRPMATHPDKAKLEWINNRYNSTGSGSGLSISNHSLGGLLPSYQDLVDDHFRKPHAFAVPGHSGQSSQAQSRQRDGSHFGHLTPISPAQQQLTSVSTTPTNTAIKQDESFAVPAPLDSKGGALSSGGGAFRCRSVSPAVSDMTFSGTDTTPDAGTTTRLVVSQFSSPMTSQEILIILSNSQSVGGNLHSMAQRSQSVPLNIMMQSVVEMQGIQGQNQSNATKITNVLLSKMDSDVNDTVRGLGINNLPSNYTARMNLTQMLETQSQSQTAPGGDGGGGGNAHQSQLQTVISSPASFELQHPQLQSPQLQSPHTQLQSPHPQLHIPQAQLQSPHTQLQSPQLQSPHTQLQSPHTQLQRPQLQSPHTQLQSPHTQLQSPQLQNPQLQIPHTQLQSPQLQSPQAGFQLLQPITTQQQQQQQDEEDKAQQQLDFNSTVKDLLGEDGLNVHAEGLNPSSQLVGQVTSELNAAVASDFTDDIRLTSDLSSSITDLNTLDADLLFDPSNQQQEQYEDATLEELKNDPLFQQICSDTVNSSFDWLECKDQPTTVEMLG
uniref:RFX-type winged-helix domain-containing protein n=1 Tax=Oncorhynchus mykiss TaxID=8022 RepID=A0A8C7M5G2_ONCMY